MKKLAGLLLVLLLVLTPAIAMAVNPNEMLADPVLESRARLISENLRCLVCQNQSIDDSDADLAHDLRVLVRERLTAGDSDDAVVKYIVDRYGEFVLLRPVVAGHTLILWIAAPVLLLAGLIAVVIGARRKRAATQLELTDEEEAVLESLQEKSNTSP
jgi:cytochrome c-type biogenesis protein CcmH